MKITNVELAHQIIRFYTSKTTYKADIPNLRYNLVLRFNKKYLYSTSKEDVAKVCYLATELLEYQNIEDLFYHITDEECHFYRKIPTYKISIVELPYHKTIFEGEVYEKVFTKLSDLRHGDIFKIKGRKFVFDGRDYKGTTIQVRRKNKTYNPDKGISLGDNIFKFK